MNYEKLSMGMILGGICGISISALIFLIISVTGLITVIGVAWTIVYVGMIICVMYYMTGYIAENVTLFAKSGWGLSLSIVTTLFVSYILVLWGGAMLGVIYVIWVLLTKVYLSDIAKGLTNEMKRRRGL